MGRLETSERQKLIRAELKKMMERKGTVVNVNFYVTLTRESCGGYGACHRRIIQSE